jgi:hypothetical protein
MYVCLFVIGDVYGILHKIIPFAQSAVRSWCSQEFNSRLTRLRWSNLAFPFPWLKRSNFKHSHSTTPPPFNSSATALHLLFRGCIKATPSSSSFYRSLRRLSRSSGPHSNGRARNLSLNPESREYPPSSSRVQDHRRLCFDACSRSLNTISEMLVGRRRVW